tara:strand:+ start:272 stop:601 length:330 start_codon:yes stop_codon:yes gene_type:complete
MKKIKMRTKSIPLTKERIASLKFHERFLRRFGIGKSRTISVVVNTPACRAGEHRFEPDMVRHLPKGKVGGTKPVVNWKKEESRNFTIAPAYNKGAYQVINKSDVKDIGR